MRRRVRDLLVPGLLVMLTALVRAGDVPKSADHPLIKRYEGSTIIQYSQKAFDEYRLVVSPDVGKGPKTLTVEGRVTRITYLVPEGRSTLEVIRNYELELKKAGFTTLSAGANSHSAFLALNAAANNVSMPSTSPANFNMFASGNARYFAAQLSRPQGDVHVALYAATIKATFGGHLYADPPDRKKTAADGQVIAQLDIVEAKPMETNMVTVSAGEMATGIAAAGSVALYGILFDTNSATVKPESMPTLDEIAKLLKGQPGLRLLVVGHTDNIGTFELNMDLSQRRAASVVQALTSKFGADPKQLTPVGVSFASPVASNKTDEGKAKNRRVQLVENVSSPSGR